MHYVDLQPIYFDTASSDCNIMFVALFSIEKFGTELHKAIISASLKENSTIWFQEYSEEDKLKLVIAKHIPFTFDATHVVIDENGGDLFVNIFF